MPGEMINGANSNNATPFGGYSLSDDGKTRYYDNGVVTDNKGNFQSYDPKRDRYKEEEPFSGAPLDTPERKQTQFDIRKRPSLASAMLNAWGQTAPNFDPTAYGLGLMQ